ncbi:MAG: hypothetical protein ABWK15_08070 [Dissulfuribacterales bacterium]
MKYIGLTVLLVLCTLLVSCGKKDMPVPIGAIHPRSINDLKYVVTPQGVELSWTIPTRNVDGSPILALKGFELYRAVLQPDNTCNGCPISFDDFIFLPMETVSKSGQKMFYEDRTLESGRRYAFELRTVKAFLNKSEPSNRVIFTWHPPASPPAQPVATSKVEGLELTWAPPTTWVDGSTLIAPVFYRVYAKKDEDEEWKLLKDRLSSPVFLYSKAPSNKVILYRVTAVSEHNGTLIESAPSPEVQAEFVSPVPPVAPTGLVAVVKPSAQNKNIVELLWQEVSDATIAGYFVYRRTVGINELKRLNQQPIAISGFEDDNQLSSGTYEYQVTAVNKAGKESQPSAPATVRIYE